VATVVRTIVYATLFVGLVLVYIPAALVARLGIVYPATFGVAQYAGVLIGTVGAAVALTCVASFATIGEGTPAPFDPPRRLVVRGPYRWIRNPMYVGAALALAGAAVFYESLALACYAFAFLIVSHLFVVFYEEPNLRRTFGDDYAAYCDRVGRWLPHRYAVTR
jgi:protein-S-isoprenylcysteine O-methyltransferase Ste14